MLEGSAAENSRNSGNPDVDPDTSDHQASTVQRAQEEALLKEEAATLCISRYEGSGVATGKLLRYPTLDSTNHKGPRALLHRPTATGSIQPRIKSWVMQAFKDSRPLERAVRLGFHEGVTDESIRLEAEPVV